MAFSSRLTCASVIHRLTASPVLPAARGDPDHGSSVAARASAISPTSASGGLCDRILRATLSLGLEPRGGDPLNDV